MKTQPYSYLLSLVFIIALSSCQVIASDDWGDMFSMWGDILEKEAWQVGIMFGLEIPSSVPINSVDEGMIAFVARSNTDEGSDAIFVIAENRQVRMLTDAEKLQDGFEFSGDVFWNPSGTHLVFPIHKLCPSDDGSAYKCEAEIYLVDVDSTSMLRISGQGEFAVDPVWSPDGLSLLYRVSDLSDPYGDDYFAERLDSGARVQVSETPEQNVSWGQWSPDQGYFSYLSKDESGVTLNVIDLAIGSEEVLDLDLSYFGSDGDMPANSIESSGFFWSPDGLSIAFSNGPESVSQRQNFLMNVNSGAVSQLSSRKGLLIYGWLDSQRILAEDHLQGIVSLSLEGEVISIVDGVLYPASSCSISPNAEAILLSHIMSNLTIPQEDIYANFVWSIPEEEVTSRIDLVDYSVGEPCWTP